MRVLAAKVAHVERIWSLNLNRFGPSVVHELQINYFGLNSP